MASFYGGGGVSVDLTPIEEAIKNLEEKVGDKAVSEQIGEAIQNIREEVEEALASLNEKIDAGIPVEYVGF